MMNIFFNFIRNTNIMNRAIVTGGAQGIGKAISLKLMQEEIFVFVIDRDQEALNDFAVEEKPKKLFETVHCDVGEETSVKNAINHCQKWPGKIKYLVNNAAISANKPMEALGLEEWNRVLAINLSSYFLTAKYLAPNLRDAKGSIVNLCSTRAFMSEPGTEAYSASKGGVYALTHALAMSLQPDVRVNSISPGWIDTEPWQKKSRPEDHPLAAGRTSAASGRPHWQTRRHCQSGLVSAV
jgi:NAD(P)-dependent dehydrogenase (short-subunit alcohol dehydrogenase family)